MYLSGGLSSCSGKQYMPSLLFSVSLELGNRKKRKRLTLLLSRRNLCLMSLHLMLSFFFLPSTCPLFPLFLISRSLYLSLPLLALLSWSHSECKAIALCNTELFWESKCHLTLTLHSVCFATGRLWVILISCHPPTQIHTHTLYI